MLTADLVRTRSKAGELHVTALKGKSKARAQELSEVYLQMVVGHHGKRYEELRAAWSSVEVGPREKRLALGLQKLIEDGCELVAESPIEPRDLRSEVFLLAAKARKEALSSTDFDREKVLAAVALGHGTDPAVVEEALYADLRSQHRLTQVPSLSAEELISRYELGQYQAVLLRAVNVTAFVKCSSVSAYRDLFRTLKFRRLLYEVSREGDGYRLQIDGPFSLFESVTKYGLQLALTFPALCRASQLKLAAEVRWGKARKPLSFNYEQKRAKKDVELESRLPDEVATLKEAFEGLKSKWKVAVNEQILDLPGVGVCIPDLVFQRGKQRVFLEVMGFWSRDAVWKRVELVEAGLPQKILFAVSQRLRVSEQVLDETASGALYVYKGVISARAVLERLNGLAGARP